MQAKVKAKSLQYCLRYYVPSYSVQHTITTGDGMYFRIYNNREPVAWTKGYRNAPHTDTAIRIASLRPSLNLNPFMLR